MITINFSHTKDGLKSHKTLLSYKLSCDFLHNRGCVCLKFGPDQRTGYGPTDWLEHYPTCRNPILQILVFVLRGSILYQSFGGFLFIGLFSPVREAGP